ncbi:hypothetical protein KC19_5G153700 [Ceratodon purpureus]|uniref:Uncharacterized protein n=1 Tax=Ceratodon purpureus TaxID=3225 RepID=A0A8T0I4E3_CERPU|nr:hypothetical protein KC19_5G153700 [Ceratodon purpureus]
MLDFWLGGRGVSETFGLTEGGVNLHLIFGRLRVCREVILKVLVSWFCNLHISRAGLKLCPQTSVLCSCLLSQADPGLLSAVQICSPPPAMAYHLSFSSHIQY